MASLLIIWGCADSLRATDLPDTAIPVIELLRSAPDDAGRLEAVARWAEAGSGLSALATGLAERGHVRGDALDLSLAGSLHESAGHPEDAIAPHDAALTLDPTLERSRLALIDLYLRGGWIERAAALVEDPASLALDAAVRLAAAGYFGGPAEARRRLLAGGERPLARAWVAWSAGLPLLAAELAEIADDLTMACTWRIEAGDADGARALLDRGARPSLDARLSLARWTGDPALLEEVLGTRTDPGAERLRRDLRRSLGEESAPREVPPDGESPDSWEVDAPPTQDPDRRREAAHAVLAGETGAELHARLGVDGPPSLAVAAAWLATGESDRARLEVVRWLLSKRPEDQRFRRSLERERPEWFGVAPSAAAVLRRLERTSEPGSVDRAAIDQALLAAPAGSDLEAALLYQRARLLGTDDLGRAGAIAPGLVVERPLPGGLRLLVPLARESAQLEPGETGLESVPLPSPLDAAVGLGPAGPIRLGSRRPTSSIAVSGHIAEWSISGEPAKTRVIGDFDAQAIAPITARIDLPLAGVLLVGQGIAFHDLGGAMSWTIVGDAPVELAELPEQFLPHIPAAILSYCAEFRAEPFELEDFPALCAAWRGVIDREGLPNDARPDFVREGPDTVILRGGGLRVELTSGTELDPGDREIDGFRRTERGWRSSDPPELMIPSRSSEPPSETLTICARRTSPATRAEHEELHPYPAGGPVDALEFSPAEFSGGVVFPAGAFSVHPSGSGWCAGVADGVVRWWAFLPPPLPGPDGWRLTRPQESATGRRGPDRTGPSSDRGLLRFRSLGDARIALLTDRVQLFDRDGELPRPEGAAGGRFSAIRDVALGESGVWVLPAPGDRIVGEGRTIELGLEGAFDIEATGEESIWLLRYDPVAVAVRLLCIRNGEIATIALPAEITVEEDRAHQRPVALGRWGERLLVASRGQVWLEDSDGTWIALLPTREETPILPTHAWQTPPRVIGDRLMVAWPWGEIEEARAP